MNDRDPIEGAGDAVVQSISALSQKSDLPEGVLNVMSNINTMLNAGIGLVITLTVLLLLLQLFRWALHRRDDEKAHDAAIGAMRALVALFLSVDVWFIIRLAQRVVDISPVVAYGVVMFSFLLLGAWSLFGIGRIVLDALSVALNWCLDLALRLIRYAEPNAQFLLWVQKRSDDALRFGVLFLVVAAVTAGVMVWTYAPTNEISTRVLHAYSVETVPGSELVRGSGDASVSRTTYSNSRYGISITFPEDWVLAVLSDSDGLVEAVDPDGRFYVRLNAGSFDDLASSTVDDAYLTALWRIQKNILGGFAANSIGIEESEISASNDIGGMKASYQRIASYWLESDGGVGFYHDGYYVFGRYPIFYTLQFRGRDDTISTEDASRIVDSITHSIHIEDPVSR